jgi:hypothetical protein
MAFWPKALAAERDRLWDEADSVMPIDDRKASAAEAIEQRIIGMVAISAAGGGNRHAISPLRLGLRIVHHVEHVLQRRAFFDFTDFRFDFS